MLSFIVDSKCIKRNRKYYQFSLKTFANFITIPTQNIKFQVSEPTIKMKYTISDLEGYQEDNSDLRYTGI